MYYTIYKVTNQITGKFYIGSHKTKNLNDNYMGSGKYLKRAQEKYGIENFTKEILFVFDTPEEMYAKEAEIVNEDFLATENTYNLMIGGHGGFGHVNKILTKDHLRNRAIAGRAATNKILQDKFGENWNSIIAKIANKASNTPEAKEKAKQTRLINNTTFKGKTHTAETKAIMSQKAKLHSKGEKNSQYGTMWITNGVESKKILKETPIPEGWYRGRKV